MYRYAVLGIAAALLALNRCRPGEQPHSPEACSPRRVCPAAGSRSLGGSGYRRGLTLTAVTCGGTPSSRVLSARSQSADRRSRVAATNSPPRREQVWARLSRSRVARTQAWRSSTRRTESVAGREGEDGAGVQAQDAVAHHQELRIAQGDPIGHGVRLGCGTRLALQDSVRAWAGQWREGASAGGRFSKTSFAPHS